MRARERLSRLMRPEGLYREALRRSIAIEDAL
jgi:hypothetical protein